jgi:transposase
LEWPAAQATLLDVRGAIDALTHRRDALERQIVAMLPSSPRCTQVSALRCLRGVDTLTAVGLCAEVGDFQRFARGAADELCRPRSVREHDRAATAPRGDHEDRVRARAQAAGPSGVALPPQTEPQQSADRPPSRSTPRSGRDLLDRAEATASHLDALGAPGKRRTIIAVAAARELAGFVWAITQIE